MSKMVNFNISIDQHVKEESEALFKEQGMDLATAINIFLKQALCVGGFPFEIKINQPNAETLLALLESERLQNDPEVTHYSDVEEALRSLKQ